MTAVAEEQFLRSPWGQPNKEMKLTKPALALDDAVFAAYLRCWADNTRAGWPCAVIHGGSLSQSRRW